MKVAFLSFDFGEYCIRLATALAQEAEVRLLLPQREADPYLSMLSQTVNLQTFIKPRLRQPFQQMQVIYKIIQQIKQFEPDVIHLQQGHLWFNFALPLLRRYPLVLTIHDPKPHVGDKGGQKTPQMMMNYGFRRATRVIVHGQYLKQMVIHECHMQGDIIHVMPHIVLGDEAAQSHVPESENVVLFFGRIWKYKGLEYLIRAEPLIAAEIPGVRIIIAGEGESFAPYRRMMAHPEHFTVYNNYVSDEKRAELFRQASVVVLPYVEATQSGVIPIAYTFSKPVVATTVGSLEEMVDDGRTGYLVPPRDERALAEAVVRLLRDRELRRQLGANGKQKVDTECSAEAVAQKTISVYHQTLNGTHLDVERGKSERDRGEKGVNSLV